MFHIMRTWDGKIDFMRTIGLFKIVASFPKLYKTVNSLWHSTRFKVYLHKTKKTNQTVVRRNLITFRSNKIRHKPHRTAVFTT